MNLKVIGGILMILGTSIGAGMLALPVASAQAGFISSAMLLILCWLGMTIGAFLILEVVLWLPENTNLISMVKLTLGKPGKIIAWLSYLMLLYTLLCAYISGNSDILQNILHALHLNIPRWVATILAVVLLGGIVYRGVCSVDIVNRGLMTGKILIYLLLVLAIAPHINPMQLVVHHSRITIVTVMVMITSFGFAIIVPSLRTYFKSDVKQLKTVIFVGSLIPLIFYLVWVAIVQGVLPVTLLKHLAVSAHTTTGLAKNLAVTVNSNLMGSLIHVFTSICALTSFLGVSLCLFDFLADGLQLSKRGLHGIIVSSITFVPPMLIILLFPGAFIRALSYAGIFVIIILMLFPAVMAWSGRYRKKIEIGKYRLWGGKSLLAIEILISIALIGWNVVHLVL
ncbi:MAG: aromatic amino acid transport family protein [Gammaproteobacteria bacterium]|jgi:tyrosine-specific transport protein